MLSKLKGYQMLSSTIHARTECNAKRVDSAEPHHHHKKPTVTTHVRSQANQPSSFPLVTSFPSTSSAPFVNPQLCGTSTFSIIPFVQSSTFFASFHPNTAVGPAAMIAMTDFSISKGASFGSAGGGIETLGLLLGSLSFMYAFAQMTTAAR